MIFNETELKGVFVIELQAHADERGMFARTFCERELAEHGLVTHFPQCNLSRNTRRGTLRGMHYQAAPHGEVKLVRCVRGAIFDVVIDLRPGSATHGKWLGVELDAASGRALYIPTGFAHGFLSLTDDSDVFYMMGSFFVPGAARGLRWNDPRFGVAWPAAPQVISERDASYPDFDPAAYDG